MINSLLLFFYLLIFCDVSVIDRLVVDAARSNKIKIKNIIIYKI
jgi:hypothetical protein